MTISFWLNEKSQEQTLRKCDLVVIGAGLTGASTAYFARRLKPELDIIVVDGGRVAGGASGRNAGFVLRGISRYYDSCIKNYGRDKARLIYQLGEENQALVREFMAGHGVSLDYVASGSYILASSIEELEELLASAELMKDDGFELKFHRQDPLDRGFYGAIENKGDFGINPVKLVKALLAASEARVFEQETVLHLECDGRVNLHTSSGEIEAEAVVLANNAFMPLLLKELLPHIKPVRGQMLATAPLRKRLLDRVCYANYGFEYFRQLQDLRLLVGGSRQHFAKEEEGWGEMVTSPLQEVLEHYIKEYFPEAAGVPIEYRWSGTMAFTNDGLPLLGRWLGADLDGVYLAGACNGHGLGLAMTLGRSVTDMIFRDAGGGIFDCNRLRSADARVESGQLITELISGP